MTQKISFTDFLESKLDDKNPIGDLARECKRANIDFSSSSKSINQSKLYRCTMMTLVNTAFNHAWAEFKGDE